MSDTNDEQGEGDVDPTAPPAPDPLAAPPSPYPPTEPIPQSPSYDQPTYGQPSYDQPTYGQPSYDQPTYGQPGPGQPVQGQPWGQPAVPPVPPTPHAYGAPQGGDPSAQPYAAYAQPTYGQPTYGQPSPYTQPYPGTYVQPANNGSALALTIVSAVSVAFCGGLLVIPALIFGIVGLTKQSSDPEGSRRMSRNGWWAYGIGVVVSIVLVVVLFAVIIASSEGSFSGTYDGY